MDEEVTFRLFCSAFVDSIKDDVAPMTSQQEGIANTMMKNVLLQDSVEVDTDENFVLFKESVELNSRYPVHPLFRTFCKNLYRTIFDDQSHQNHIPNGLVAVQTEFPDHFIQSCQQIKNKFRERRTSHDVVDIELKRLLHNIRDEDVLRVLGLNRTKGSIDFLPPDIHVLWTSYQCRHHPKSKLTVGARALSKHCHRSTVHFWGVCTGSEEAKNNHALDVLGKIFENCVWINIHVLPHDVYVLEIRCAQGYGLRWSHDGKTFRGFLEPQMENGHEVGWRH